MVLPDVIMPIAERNNLVVPIGDFVLRRACQDLARWNKPHCGVITQLTVNVSARQVSSPNFAASVTDVLAETGVDPAQLTIELTETTLLEDNARVLASLEDIRARGVALSMDDFGTGYSCLAYLRRFPFAVIKIDRSFIADIVKEPSTRTIVAGIIDLSHQLGLTVVAEGIETQSQLDHVTGLGADLVQGHFLSRPLMYDQISRLLPDPASPATVIRLPVSA